MRKSVFFVFSHITFYLSLSIIDSRSISKKDVILITARNYSNKFHEFECIAFDDEYNKLSKISYLNFYKGWPYIKKIDNIIQSRILNDFDFYLPHISSPLIQIIASNERCISLTFFEEGSLAYRNQVYFKPKELYRKLIRRTALFFLNTCKLYGLGRYYKIPFYDYHYFEKDTIPEFFAIHPAAFTYIVGNKINIISLYKEDIEELRDLTFNHPILIFDGWCGYTGEDIEIYKLPLKILSQKLQSNILNVKFHPWQKEKEREQIINYLVTYKFSYNIIPDEIPMEQIFIHNSNLRVIGFSSSLLYYANMLGHKVWSLSKFYQLGVVFSHSQGSRGQKTLFPIDLSRWKVIEP